MKTGTVAKWVQEKNYGFIRPDDDGNGVHFQAGSFCNPEELAHVAPGRRVERGAASYHVRLLPEDTSSDWRAA